MGELIVYSGGNNYYNFYDTKVGSFVGLVRHKTTQTRVSSYIYIPPL